jgi:hypothetical protein
MRLKLGSYGFPLSVDPIFTTSSQAVHQTFASRSYHRFVTEISTAMIEEGT